MRNCEKSPKTIRESTTLVLARGDGSYYEGRIAFLLPPVSYQDAIFTSRHHIEERPRMRGNLLANLALKTRAAPRTLQPHAQKSIPMSGSSSTATVDVHRSPDIPPPLHVPITTHGEASAEAQGLKTPITSYEKFISEKAVREEHVLYVLWCDGEVMGYAKTGYKDL